MTTEKPVLNDPDQYPAADLIHTCIGKRSALWNALFNSLHEQHPDFSEDWRYYKDGKSWLMKVTRKSKTIFWVSVRKNAFSITFYFADKAEPLIDQSGISEKLKTQFKEGKRFGKIRGLTIDFTANRDIDYAQTLVGIRLKA